MEVSHLLLGCRGGGKSSSGGNFDGGVGKSIDIIVILQVESRLPGGGVGSIQGLHVVDGGVLNGVSVAHGGVLEVVVDR